MKGCDEMEKYYKQISTWGRLLGVLMIASAVPMAIMGVVGMALSATGGSFLFGFILLLLMAISSASMAWIGKILYESGKHAKEYLLNPSEEKQDELIGSYGEYVFGNAILTIGSIVLVVPLAFVLAGLAMAMV